MRTGFDQSKRSLTFCLTSLVQKLECLHFWNWLVLTIIYWTQLLIYLISDLIIDLNFWRIGKITHIYSKKIIQNHSIALLNSHCKQTQWQKSKQIVKIPHVQIDEQLRTLIGKNLLNYSQKIHESSQMKTFRSQVAN